MKQIILIIVIVIASVLTGCISSDVQSSKAQPIITQTQPIITPTPAPTKEIKVINLDAKQLVLEDNEIKNILGKEWNNNVEWLPNLNTAKFSNVPTSSIIHVIYSIDPLGCGAGTINNEFIYYPVDISVRVYNDFIDAKKDYHILSNNYYIGNSINIGDEGIIYTITIDQLNQSIIKVVFRKNNVLSIIYLSSRERCENDSFNIDTAIKLAKKQDEKISKILEMIK